MRVKSPSDRSPAAPATAAGVVLAAGSGTRFGGSVNKAYLRLGERSLVSWSLDVMARIDGISPLVLVIRQEDRRHAEEVLDEVDAEVELVHGGSTRHHSELLAFRHLRPRIEAGTVDSILVHDSARPLLSVDLCAAVLRATRAHGAAVPVLEGPDLTMVREGGDISSGPHRSRLVRTQTPQGFEASSLLQAYETAWGQEFHATDTAGCFARCTDRPIRWVPGEDANFKITYAHDLLVAQRLLPVTPRTMTHSAVSGPATPDRSGRTRHRDRADPARPSGPAPAG
ncbi:2-C-methyl-D-erythritol 4-phosphate cytidylyltransferase [Kocuria rhizosphaericola]|uniref:IspD/TarI family cytidylyltransferase n=1 Tax=Kocuria rhizosphaericola TaxID=3376284 RepID=UPI0037A3EFC5